MQKQKLNEEARLDEKLFVLLLIGSVSLTVSSAVKLQTGLNSAHERTEGLHWPPHGTADARTSFFHGFHCAGEDSVCVYQLHAQAIDGFGNHAVHALHLTARDVSDLSSVRNHVGDTRLGLFHKHLQPGN